MFKDNRLSMSADGDSLTLAVTNARRERVCNTVCDMHECIISGCTVADTVGFLMDRLLSLEPRDVPEQR
ncbi:hypothetical protein [Peteryoungia ipomoeae]|uniref:Uncharacterized protein n=1 Tax=Peteryoungia ipomoeae TaxID=1210932 RepID=A0A4S8NTV5_9HYPH|nr:hypothetical protein [Peteryoungia ipomoeae]THV20933.1 hypothetical protein FAA97_17210 [Peteryoungia ipomoeae]